MSTAVSRLALATRDHVPTAVSSPLEIAILVQSAPDEPGNSLALRFAAEAIRKGHAIPRVFFYKDAVNTGDGRGEFSAQGFGVRRGWQSLTRTNGTELLVCSASGSRRGIPPSALASCFISSGLGQLAAMTLESDRLVCF